MKPRAYVIILVLCFALAGMSWQNVLLKSRLRTIELEERPYLFAGFQYRFLPEDEFIVFGASILFKNNGNFHATDIKTEYIVSDDTPGGLNYEHKQWYKDEYGDFPEITMVPAKDNVGPIIYTPRISKDARFACIGVKVTYSGSGSRTGYWYKRLNVFRIIRDENGIPEDLRLINSDIDWDKNGDEPAPELFPPDWSKYDNR